MVVKPPSTAADRKDPADLPDQVAALGGPGWRRCWDRRGRQGADGYWLDLRHVKHGVYLEKLWELETESGGIDHPLYGVGADVPGSQFPGEGG